MTEKQSPFNLPKNFLQRMADNIVLHDSLLSEAIALENSGKLASRAAAFFIYLQIEESYLDGILSTLDISTSHGSFMGSKKVIRKPLLPNDINMTLGRKLAMLENFFVEDIKIDQLKNLKIILRKLVPLRNRLTHHMLDVKMDYTEPHKDILESDIKEAIAAVKSLGLELRKTYDLLSDGKFSEMAENISVKREQVALKSK